jgi:predicted nucleic acid-binding protein
MEELQGRRQAMSLIIDSSATLAKAYPEETTAAIDNVFMMVADEGAWVPTLWRVEVANVLSLGVRRGRMTAMRRESALTDLADLPIFEDAETGMHAWGKTIVLAEAHKLTVYDATYLELALRLSLPLATLDDDLRSAAQREGIPLLGR